MIVRTRRSVLYVPAVNARAIEKARTLPVDVVVLDLEDSVAPESKEAARKQATEAVSTGGFGAREVVVRINGLDTEWWLEDVNAAVAVKPDAILVPKISMPGHLQDIAERLVDISADQKIRVWAMIETALAILNVGEIAAAAKDVETRLTCFVIGTNDLARETRTQLVAERWPMVPWLMSCIVAARAHGVDILDGVYNDIKDAEGFAKECAQGRAMGFVGKSIIHPSQIAPCNAAFSPTADEVAQARKIIAAFELPENEDKGVVALDGRMVERLHADIARHTIAVAEAITARA